MNRKMLKLVKKNMEIVFKCKINKLVSRLLLYLKKIASRVNTLFGVKLN